MGPHGIETMNENRELFLDFWLNKDLLIGGHYFNTVIFTRWLAFPDRKIKNQIDHIAISTKWNGNFRDVDI